MPNPFNSNQGGSSEQEEQPDFLPVENSTLVCEKCFAETSTGQYWLKHRRLTFTCPNGHDNMVKDIEL